MSRRRGKRREPLLVDPVSIESLSHDGRGVARIEGKTAFVHGALPGERVAFERTRKRRDYDQGRAVAIHEAAPDRVEPRCPHFGVCGGCALQHLDPAGQLAAKQQTLLDNLSRIGRVGPERVLDPLTGPVWGYRRRARLGVKHVVKKGRVLVGFREREAPYVTDTTRCEVLDPGVGKLLEPLGALILGLSVPDRIPQIEVAVADNVTGLVLRNLDPLTDADHAALRAFEQEHGLAFYLQPGGPETITPLTRPAEPLEYRLPEHDIAIRFEPADFIQINGALNRAMVDHALALLEVGQEQHVLDLFCGLGNFSMPLARRVARVTGVEGDAALVARARQNAERNGTDNVEFHAANLFEPVREFPWGRRRYDRILLDPPRAGAREIIAEFPRFGAERVVYVSCHPGTLARDAGLLVHELGYRLEAAGVMDMFPHTAHVESIALFVKP